MKKGDVYKGFRVIDDGFVEDCSSNGIFLRHEESGLEVYHLLNDDEENLFAFAFRTPSDDSTGAPHILEHSVLCGSERYPLKDPFLKLANQSLSTYLNAYTSPDRTVFPASSLIKKDFKSLMSVYADAVFFPLLKDEVFQQEAWRIDFDREGKPEIQGVVYNEMKGNYASLHSVISHEYMRAVARGTNYDHDSGGDPLEIPSLSPEELRKFHKKYYCTKNCLVFLYGNIPTEEHLDFLYENIISRVKDYGCRVDYSSYEKNPPIEKKVKSRGPTEDENSRPSAGIVWRIGKPCEDEDLFLRPLEILLVSDLLFGEDCAPVRNALLEHFPESSISPQTGPDIQSRFFSTAIALEGIGEESVDEFLGIVRKTLESVCENGMPSEDIERTVMLFDISNREIRRYFNNSPYSLVLLKRVLRAWTYGKNPAELLSFRQASEKIKEKIKSDFGYIPSLIRKFFLENDDYSVICVEPSVSWAKERSEAESCLAAKILESSGECEIRRKLDAMHVFQDGAETFEEKNLIPSIKPSELDEIYEDIKVCESSACGIPLYSCEQPVNGIVYLDISFPVDRLSPSDYRYLTLLESAVTDLGFGKYNWKEASSLINRTMGSFTTYVRNLDCPKTAFVKPSDKPLIVGRQWFVFHMKFLEEKTFEVFRLLEDFIRNVDFSDKKRLRNIINSDYSDMKASFVSHAHLYARTRAKRKLDKVSAIDEILDGITTFFSYGELKKAEIGDVSAKLSEIYGSIIESGAVISITAEKNAIEKCRPLIENLVGNLSLKPPLEKIDRPLSDFTAVTEIPGEDMKNDDAEYDEVFVIPGSIGFASVLVESSLYDTENAVSDEVFTHLMQTSELWKQIRMTGGAYGVYLSSSSMSGTTNFLTYRDPKPFESVEYFSKFKMELGQKMFSEDEVEKAVTGVYSGDIAPDTPAAKGSYGFYRILSGIDVSQVKRRIHNLLCTGKMDVEKSAKRYCDSRFVGEKVIVCGRNQITQKNKNKCGKIIKIQL